MRLNFNPTIPVNSLINSYQINRSAANQTGGQNGVKAEEERRDSFTLSPEGGKRNLISNLMKQKIDIADRRSALIASVKEKGTSMDSIKPQLEALDEQLRNIDVQISQAIADEAKKQEEEKGQENKEPQTSEELRYEKMTDVVTLSEDVKHVDLLDSAKNRVDGRIKVLKSEIALDDNRVPDGSLGGATTTKKRELADLETRSVKIASDIGSRMVDIIEETDENNETVPVKESDDSEEADVSNHTGDEEDMDEE